MIKKYVIVTPIWKKFLDAYEYKLVSITNKNNKEISKSFIAPNHLNCEFYKKHFPEYRIFRIPDKNLDSIDNYNRYLLTPDLYKKFAAYEFLIICQTDAVLIKNIGNLQIDEYEYIGAPWIEPKKVNIFGLLNYRYFKELFKYMGLYYNLYVGNGGLSIRRVDKFIHVTERNSIIDKVKCNEDTFFSYLCKKGDLKAPNKEIANQIFIETTAMTLNEIPNVYGFHALQKYNRKLFEKLINEEFL